MNDHLSTRLTLESYITKHIFERDSRISRPTIDEYFVTGVVDTRHKILGLKKSVIFARSTAEHPLLERCIARLCLRYVSLERDFLFNAKSIDVFVFGYEFQLQLEVRRTHYQSTDTQSLILV